MHTLAYLFIDGQFDGGKVGGNQCNAIAVAHLRQARGKLGRVFAIESVRDFGDVLVAEIARSLCNLPLNLIEKRHIVIG